MATKTRKEYEKTKKEEPILEKKSQKQEAGKIPLPVSIVEQVPPVVRKTFIIQDPESRTFKDSVILVGRQMEREVVRGTLKTNEEVLKDFLIGKGWILISTLEN